jgi:antitoxin component of RelBE/YafQ-DinJ toxin-antitoxin module
MSKYTTVSAKIDTKLKEKITRYNISVSEVIKKLWRKRLEEEKRKK